VGAGSSREASAGRQPDQSRTSGALSPDPGREGRLLRPSPCAPGPHPGAGRHVRPHYRRFLVYNAAGGVVWAASSCRRVPGRRQLASCRARRRPSQPAPLPALVLGAAIALIALWIGRHQDPLPELASASSTRPAMARLRALYGRQLDFLARRLRRRGRSAFRSTTSLAALVARRMGAGRLSRTSSWGDGSIRFDQPVLRWFVRHREPWLTTAMRSSTSRAAPPSSSPGPGHRCAWFAGDATAPTLALLSAAYGGLLPPVPGGQIAHRSPARRPAWPSATSAARPSLVHATEARPCTACSAVVVPPAAPAGGTKWPPGPRPPGPLHHRISRLYLAAHWSADVWPVGPSAAPGSSCSSRDHTVTGRRAARTHVVGAGTLRRAPRTDPLSVGRGWPAAGWGSSRIEDRRSPFFGVPRLGVPGSGDLSQVSGSAVERTPRRALGWAGVGRRSK